MVSCGTRKQLKDKNQYDSIRFCLTWWPRYYARCWASHGPYLFTGTSSLTGEWEGHSKLATKHGQQLGIETEHHVSQICREVEMICVREWLKSDCWYIWRNQIMRNLKAFSFQPIQSGNRWWFEMFYRITLGSCGIDWAGGAGLGVNWTMNFRESKGLG